jgi:hypothetical protein
MKTNSAEREEAITYLKSRLRPGLTLYTCLRSVSSTGMSRTLDLYYVSGKEIARITWSAALVLEWTYDRRAEAMRVSGCGLDVGHHTVASLSRVLFGDEQALRHRWL